MAKKWADAMTSINRIMGDIGDVRLNTSNATKAIRSIIEKHLGETK